MAGALKGNTYTVVYIYLYNGRGPQGQYIYSSLFNIYLYNGRGPQGHNTYTVVYIYLYNGRGPQGQYIYSSLHLPVQWQGPSRAIHIQ